MNVSSWTRRRGFTAESIETVASAAITQADREHVTSYYREIPMNSIS